MTLFRNIGSPDIMPLPSPLSSRVFLACGRIPIRLQGPGATGGPANPHSVSVLRTQYRAPKANAICERFRGSVRQECLDHILILNRRHLHRLMKEYRVTSTTRGRTKALG